MKRYYVTDSFKGTRVVVMIVDAQNEHHACNIVQGKTRGTNYPGARAFETTEEQVSAEEIADEIVMAQREKGRQAQVLARALAQFDSACIVSPTPKLAWECCYSFARRMVPQPFADGGL